MFSASRALHISVPRLYTVLQSRPNSCVLNMQQDTSGTSHIVNILPNVTIDGSIFMTFHKERNHSPKSLGHDSQCVSGRKIPPERSHTSGFHGCNFVLTLCVLECIGLYINNKKIRLILKMILGLVFRKARKTQISNYRF